VFAIKGDCWSASLSPDRSRVVFSSYVNGRGQIYTVNADATVLTGVFGPVSWRETIEEQVVKPYWANGVGPHGPGGTFTFKSSGVNVSGNDFCDHSPVWSSDGKRIAFVSDRDGDWEIYVMNADGTDQRRLTRSPGTDRAPAWSPDGSRIAFESDRGGDFDIYVIGSDGADERLLVDRSGNDLEPRWSPDGDRIACIAQGSSSRELLAVDTRTGVPERGKVLTGDFKNISGICWSPDGRLLAYGSGSDIWIIPWTAVDGAAPQDPLGTIKTKVNLTVDYTGTVSKPSWSADGTMIAAIGSMGKVVIFDVEHPDNNFEITYKIADGSDVLLENVDSIHWSQ